MKNKSTACVDLIGRMCNNFFQIAMCFAYSIKHNVECYIPAWQYSKCFKTDFTKYAVGTKFVGEDGFHYQEFPLIKNVKFFGYFQSEKYFKHCEDKIRELFTFNDQITEKINNKYGEVLKQNTCSIHVRRGDYVGNGLHEVCHLQYYKDAIAEMKKRTNIDLFLIFSDDIEWAKSNLKGENFLFVEDNSDIEDLCLMTKCIHHIISNSSYSWWGQYLANNPNKLVIAPDKWFNDGGKRDTKDLYLDNWILIKIE